MRILLWPLLAWNAWLLASYFVRFHLPPSVLSGSFTQYFVQTHFSWAALAGNWAGFARAAADLAGLSALAWLAGGVLMRAVLRGGSGALVRLTAGFGFLGTATLAAGLVGLLYSPPAAVTHLGLAALAAWTAWRTRPSWRIPAFPLPPLTRPVAVLLALCAVVALAGIPNIEVAWDALSYHLRLPSFYVYRHKFFDVWHHYCAPFPSQVEITYGLGLLVEGEYLARFMNALFCLLLIPATLSLGRSAGIPARWAPAMLVFTPLMTALATRAYIDPAMALFLTVSLDFLVQWMRGGKRGALAAGALFAGWGLASKYTGAFFLVGALALAWPRLRRPGGWKAAALGAGVMLLPFLPWLAKNWLYRGNPVWPYLGALFGSVAEVPGDITPFFEAPNPLASLLQGLFRHAGNLAFDNGRVDGPLLPAVAGFLPLLALSPRDEGTRLLRRAMFGYLAAWAALAPDVRFLLPVLPALLLLLDSCVAELAALGRTAALATRGFLEAGLAVGALYGAAIQWVFFSPFVLPLGLETAQRKLTLMLEPPPWASYAKDFVNANVPRGDRIMFLSHFSSYYFERECIAEFHYGRARITRLVNDNPTAEAMDRRLRQQGIRWLLDVWGGPLQYTYINGFYAATGESIGEFKRLLSERAEPVWQGDKYTLYRLGRRHAPRPLPSLPVWGWTALEGLLEEMDRDPRGALARLDAAPALVQDVGTTLMHRGDILNVLGDLPGAVRAYRRALATGLDVPRLRLGLAHSLLMLGRAREALPHAEAAHKGNPLSGYNAATLATVENALGNNARAVELAREAVRLAPGNQAYRSLLAQMGGTLQ